MPIQVFARERRKAGESVCVCVCVFHTLFLRVLLVTHELQGGREDLQGSAHRSSLQDPRKRKLMTSVYLQLLNFCQRRDSTSPFSWFIVSWFLHDTSPKPFSFRRFQLPRDCRQVNTLLNYPNELTLPPCGSIVHFTEEQS